MFFDRTSTGFGKSRTGRRADDRADLRILKHAETYWRSLVGTARVPKRSDIDPSALGEALPNTMILERVAPGMARVRLAGQFLNQIFDMDVRGMPASILVAPGSRKALGAQIEALFAGPAIVEVPLQLNRSWGRKTLSARLLMMPLTDGYGRVNRAMAVLVVDDAANVQGHTRFDIAEDGAFRCTVLPKPAEGAAKVPGADRRRPLSSPTLQEVLPVRSPLPLFGIVEGGTDRTNRREEPRPALRLVVDNDA